jgi:hypothetical protein
MSHKSSEKFWLEDPCVLIYNFCKFSPFGPFTNSKFSKNMNAYTRLVIIITIVIFTITKQINYVYLGTFSIIIIIIIYYSLRKESFNISSDTYKNNAREFLHNAELPRRQSDYYNTNQQINNPLKNLPITDYDKEQEYSKASRSDSDMSKYANGKIFQTSDQWIFDRNTQPFYTTPNTLVPNDQTGFANWLYGTENICKEGSIYMHRTGTPEQSLNCNGFNIATPTNFGNLNDYLPPNN